MKPLRIFFLLALCMSFLSTAAIAEDASDDNTGRDDTQVYHLYAGLDVVSILKFEYGKPRIVIKSVIPQLQSSTTDYGTENVEDDDPSIERFNTLAVELAQQKIAEYRNQVAEMSAKQTEPTDVKPRNNLYIDYNTSFVRANTPIISIRFSIQGYVNGAAHPYHQHAVLNYDLKNAEEIQLADLFKPGSDYLTILSNYTSSVLHQRLRDKQSIAAGTSARPENFRNWNIKANGLLITFDEYQVAPYVDGAQTVLVPYSVLSEVLAEDSPLSGCIKNKKRCANSNVLTGGFIDTAANIHLHQPRHRPLNPILSER